MASGNVNRKIKFVLAWIFLLIPCLLFVGMIGFIAYITMDRTNKKEIKINDE